MHTLSAPRSWTIACAVLLAAVIPRVPCHAHAAAVTETGPLPAARGAQGASVTGCWNVIITFGTLGEVPAQLNLRVDGALLVGTFTGPRRRSQLIERGSVRGAHLSFTIVGPRGTMVFEGELVSGRLRGVARASRGALPWRGVRCGR